eukprot:760279-Hanusia_phi.AAC.4
MPPPGPTETSSLQHLPSSRTLSHNYDACKLKFRHLPSSCLTSPSTASKQTVKPARNLRTSSKMQDSIPRCFVSVSHNLPPPCAQHLSCPPALLTSCISSCSAQKNAPSLRKLRVKPDQSEFRSSSTHRLRIFSLPDRCTPGSCSSSSDALYIRM